MKKHVLAATLRDLGLVKVRSVLGEDEQELVALAKEILHWSRSPRTAIYPEEGASSGHT